MKPKAIVFDIDGVLVKSDFLLKETEELELQGDLKWDYFYNHLDRAEIIPQMELIYKSIRYGNPELYCLLCTARNVRSKENTLRKLAENQIACDGIYMRSECDLRSDTVVKCDLLKQIQEQYDIVAFIDDKEDNCNMAKSLGIFSLRVV